MSQIKIFKIQTEVDGFRWGEWDGINGSWMSRAIISVSVIRVQTVFQTGVWFCYKSSRLVSGLLYVFQIGVGSALDNILVLFLALQVRHICLGFTAEY